MCRCVPGPVPFACLALSHLVVRVGSKVCFSIPVLFAIVFEDDVVNILGWRGRHYRSSPAHSSGHYRCHAVVLTFQCYHDSVSHVEPERACYELPNHGVTLAVPSFSYPSTTSSTHLKRNLIPIQPIKRFPIKLAPNPVDFLRGWQPHPFARAWAVRIRANASHNSSKSIIASIPICTIVRNVHQPAGSPQAGTLPSQRHRSFHTMLRRLTNPVITQAA